MLRILAGQSKGKLLTTPKNASFLRPILIRVKKSLFDILAPRIQGARFLDLYAGTGAVGLEALSRGASRVTFVEQSSICLDALHENVEKLGYKGRAEVFRSSVQGDLRGLSKPYDIIFMGPPYKDDEKKPLALVHPTLEMIKSNEFLAPGGLIIAQHHKKEEVASTEEWDMFRRNTYGDTILSFFRRKTA